ncbi:MAG TPA: phosphoribosylformylglycinamidine synthase subunit PurS, partial [Chitinophagales bacterium]|nr:phosphoribosylformylglycinamidine synthase subunit PurS [Chitinophagales bacterium]
MNFRAEINVMPHKELLDPQGKAVAAGLHKMNFNEVTDVRIGKHLTIKLSAASEAEAKQKLEEACKKLLANPIMESYTFELFS